MALTVTITPSQSTHFGNGVNDFIIGITNTSGSNVTLRQLQVFSNAGASANIQQPVFLTNNVALSDSYPTIVAAATNYYSCKVVFNAPAFAGPSPQAPGGPQGSSNAMTPVGQYAVSVIALASDNAVGTAQCGVPVASTIAPFPIALGGAYQFKGASNLINGIAFSTI